MNDKAIIFVLVVIVTILTAALIFTYGRLSYCKEKNKELEEKITRIKVGNEWRNCYAKLTEYANLIEQVSKEIYMEVLEFRTFCENKMLESNNPNRQTSAEIIDLWWKKRKEWEPKIQKAYASLPSEERKGQEDLHEFMDKMHAFVTCIFGYFCKINYYLS